MVWEPSFAWGIIAALTLGCSVAATISILRSRTLAGGPRRAAVWILRMLAIGALAVILANPVRHDVATQHSGEPLSVLLVDRSDSMALGSPARFGQAMAWSEAVAKDAPCRIAGFGDDVVFDSGFGVGGATTRLALALRRVIASHSGDGLRNIIVVSDGQAQDRGELSDALALAARNGVKISTHLVGRDETPRNLFVQVCQVERSVPAGTRVPVEVEVGATGYPDGARVGVALRKKDGSLLATAKPELHDGKARARFDIKTGIRSESYSVAVDAQPEEWSAADNAFDFTVDVADPKIRVLYCEGSDDRITEMYGEMWNSSELLPTAFRRAGNIDCDTFVTRAGQLVAGRTLTHVARWQDHDIVYDVGRGLPETREGWMSYDVIIAADVQRACFTEEQLQWTVELVAERGGGFAMLGGMTAFDVGKWQETVWERLVPVEMEQYGFGHKWVPTRPVFPESVQSHPILQIDPDPEKNRRILDAHPIFLGLHDIRRAKPGATILARREGNDAPLIVVQSYGKGRTMAYLSDPTGGWGEQFQGRWGPALLGESLAPSDGAAQPPAPNEYYNRFWANTVRWLAENSVRRWRMDLLGRTEAVTYRPGDVVKVAATLPGVLDPADLPKQVVGARLAIDGGVRRLLRYDPDRKEFTGELTLPDTIASGEVGVIFDTTIAGKPRSDEVRVRVLRANPELEKPNPDARLMADLAAGGGGAALQTPEDAVAFLRRTAAEEAGEQRIPVSEPLWSRWPAWAILILLLGAEWIVRRTGREETIMRVRRVPSSGGR